MKIALSVTTYNRMEYVRKMSLSLYASRAIDDCHIRVYDDCSTQYGKKDLRKLFPGAKEIVIREENYGPSFHMREVFKDFLKTKDDVLVNADSDLIFHPDWLMLVRKTIHKTRGIMSLYNGSLHSHYKEETIGSIPFVLKKCIGNAGTVMTRDIVQKIIENCPANHAYDDSWSAYLRSQNTPIYVTQMSMVQHIGVQGYNTTPYINSQTGLNFSCGNAINEKLLIDHYENALKEKHEYIHKIYAGVVYKTGYAVLYPFYKLYKMLRKINFIRNHLDRLYKKIRNK